MAGINGQVMNASARVENASSQIIAIAWLRWRLFVNALRSTSGQLELASRVLIFSAFAFGGFGGGAGMAVGTFFFISRGKPEMLALMMWPIFLFWQAFPVMTTAFSSAPDSSELLRFPLSYRSYFLVRMAYGAFDAATVLVVLWCFGIFVGVGFAKPQLLPWTLLVLLAFAAFNVVFLQMIFSWLERWLAQRRTREILGILFVLLMLSFQLIGPLAGHFGHRARPQAQQWIAVLAPVQGVLPPGLAADAIAQSVYSRFPEAGSSIVLLCAFTLLAGYFVHVRLLAQYRGENLSEAPAAVAQPRDRSLRLGWNLIGFKPPVAAVFEKEVRYLLRSGPMLLTLIMPVFVLVIFRFGAMNSARHSSAFFARVPDMAFPITVAYTLLMLVNFVYNSFGGDAGGVQFFYASPVGFREIVLGKNLTHAGILVVETILAWTAASFFYGIPALDVTVATLAGLLFAAPLNFSLGNLLSIYSPKKLNYSAFGRQNASQTTVLISMGVQVVVVGVGATVFWLSRSMGTLWFATLILFGLAAVSLFAYSMILSRLDRIARERQEAMMAELCRS